MTDDQAPPNDVPAEAPPQAETPQTPVSDGLANTPSEPIAPAPSEPTPAVVVEPLAPAPTPEAEAPSEPAQSVSEAVPEAVAAEPRSEPEAPELEPAPRTQGAASAAQPASANAPLNTTPQAARELLVKARAKIQTKKQIKLEKIMTLFDTKEKITNDDVEKLLHVSDATALRYLKELVKQGKIKRVGTTGAGVEYTKI